MSSTLYINGNEAVAYAALTAGVDYFAHYPGSPVNFIEPALKKLNAQYQQNIVFNDSVNEHVAALAAAGASFTGARSLLVMKHVGLNIASDPLNYLGYSGVKGGMVIIVGTDPGANSSTGEEDVHWYARQFNFPLFEPVSINEIYDHTLMGFELSETYEVPVLIFITGLICHNTSALEWEFQPKEKKSFYFHQNRDAYINVGQRAVTNHKKLITRIKKYAKEQCQVKEYFNTQALQIIITRGNTFGHVYETVQLLGLEDKIKLIQFSGVYPIPENAIANLLNGATDILIVEDQDGFLENQIKMDLFNSITCPIHGKDIFPAYGEITFEQVILALSDYYKIKYEVPEFNETEIPERLGSFCEGCPHTASYFAIEHAIPREQRIIGGDIGCSSLPPFKADWLLCMNAGIGISQGMSHFVDQQTLVSTGGDGSFFHGGLLSLLNAVQNKTQLLHIVFDNRTIAMTGHQLSPSVSVNYHILLKAIGVDSVREVFAFRPQELESAILEMSKDKGVRVIWVNGSCALIPDPISQERRANLYPVIDPTQCGTCDLCYESLACPAIENNGDIILNLSINLDRCMRCGVCHEICPNGAITIHQKVIA